MLQRAVITTDQLKAQYPNECKRLGGDILEIAERIKLKQIDSWATAKLKRDVCLIFSLLYWKKNNAFHSIFTPLNIIRHSMNDRPLGYKYIEKTYLVYYTIEWAAYLHRILGVPTSNITVICDCRERVDLCKYFGYNYVLVTKQNAIEVIEKIAMNFDENVGNPPFTRGVIDIPTELKEKIGYHYPHTAFALTGLSKLNNGGEMSIIMPIQYMVAHTTKEFRIELIKNYTVLSIEILPFNKLFDDVNSTVGILHVKNEKPTTDFQTVKVIRTYNGITYTTNVRISEADNLIPMAYGPESLSILRKALNFKRKITIEKEAGVYGERRDNGVVLGETSKTQDNDHPWPYYERIGSRVEKRYNKEKDFLHDCWKVVFANSYGPAITSMFSDKKVDDSFSYRALGTCSIIEPGIGCAHRYTQVCISSEPKFLKKLSDGTIENIEANNLQAWMHSKLFNFIISMIKKGIDNDENVVGLMPWISDVNNAVIELGLDNKEINWLKAMGIL